MTYVKPRMAVRGVIMRGEVEPGDRLPAARDLAVSLDVNVHTVLRAYQQLRDDGIVELRRGRGAVVSPRADSRAELDDAIDRVVETAKRLGMTAIGMTDHGNMFGASEFYNTAVKNDIKPIIGTEAYLTPGTHRSDRSRVRWGNGGGDDVSGGGA